MTEPQNISMNQDLKDTNPMVTPVNKAAEAKLPARKEPSDITQPDSTLDAPSTPHPAFIDVTKRCFVSTEQLKRYTDPNKLPTDTRTAPDLDIGFGQQRALKALQTALDILSLIHI